uniref:Guanylyl cyclase C n=1 Tax=Cyprinodon variegatus TaxID=28743 RepID=A0A3Q2DJG6_CYPVA
MSPCCWWLIVCTFWAFAALCRGNGQCGAGITINVILLEDEESPWSLKYVESEIEEAVLKDNNINVAQVSYFNFHDMYVFSSMSWKCLYIGLQKSGLLNFCSFLQITGKLGCAVLGPTCTFATFPLVDAEKGFNLSTPIISAGSFGRSCDSTLNLQRVLPPARKISDFFIKFWLENNSIKPEWKTAYVYKKANNTEDLHHLYWLSIPSVFLPLCSDVYYTNPSSLPEMKNVLVLTMPNTREYVINSDFRGNKTMNDYMAAYHDSVLYIGQVMREIFAKNQSDLHGMDYVNVNYFRNTSFKGLAGNYKLDIKGDRDTNFSILYTTTSNEVMLFFFYIVICSTANLHSYRADFHLLGSVCFFFRQNRKDRLLRKRWCHINSDLISLLEDSQHNIISLKIEDERKKVKFQIRRALYDKKIVILKELKNSDGNFNKTQTMELNALLNIDYYNLTKFYGTVRFDEGVFGVFEYGERGSLRYVLNDKISYPEDTFMDWEFKISVMYDIAKGMSYLHASTIQVHGRLKSTNCVVDNRMVVKITDFGCNAFLSSSKDLWTAPEHLRDQGTSQKGDVYSFAIISQEIVLRKSTFYTQSCSNRSEKLSRVMTSYFRPDLDIEVASEKELEVYMMIKNCWDEDPEKRPDFKKVENCLGKHISKIHNQDNESYMDNMIRRLQNYSRNLEHLVEKRTALYKAERDRADFLNFMLLPGPVVKSLKETGVVEPELYDEVTIYFSDIVGFTTLCQYSTPMEVVDMLNDIYKGFDSIVDNHDVYKLISHTHHLCARWKYFIALRAGKMIRRKKKKAFYQIGTAMIAASLNNFSILPLPAPYRENVQRLQQDLAQMILSCLERRKQGSIRRKGRSVEEEEDEGRESEGDSEGGHPEYLQLATVDNTLSTFL